MRPMVGSFVRKVSWPSSQVFLKAGRLRRDARSVQALEHYESALLLHKATRIFSFPFVFYKHLARRRQATLIFLFHIIACRTSNTSGSTASSWISTSERARPDPLLQYGSGVFEGMRAYATDRGPAIFRLDDHVNRLINSAKIYDMDIGLSAEQLRDAVISTVRKNGLAECYIRPFSFYNDAHIGVNPIGHKVSTIVAAVPIRQLFPEQGKGHIVQGFVLAQDKLPGSAAASEGERQLPKLSAGFARGEEGRSGRGHNALRRRLCRRGVRREHIPGQGQRPSDALSRIRHTPGHNQGHRDKAGRSAAWRLRKGAVHREVRLAWPCL